MSFWLEKFFGHDYRIDKIYFVLRISYIVGKEKMYSEAVKWWM